MPIIGSREQGDARMLDCLIEMREFYKLNPDKRIKTGYFTKKYQVTSIAYDMLYDIISSPDDPTIDDVYNLRQKIYERRTAKQRRECCEIGETISEDAAINLLKNMGYRILKPTYTEI